MKKIPKKLKKEPLLEALLEIRFSCDFSASTILPGLLFTKLDGDKVIEQLPSSQIPMSIREADPNLRYASINRIIWNNFSINIGDRGISISCQVPYPGWSVFNEAIMKVMMVVADANVIHHVERCSIKNIDIIPSEDRQKQITLLDCDIAIAGRKLANEVFQLRTEIHEEGLIHIVSLMSAAETYLPDGSVKQGIVVDIDTIALFDNVPLRNVFSEFGRIREANKAMFFDCLTQDTINSLEPIYE